LVYVPGALPCFEAFGNLPTDLIREDGLVDGKPASEVLDLLIIPGGSLVESQSITEAIIKEIKKMADSDKFVLGICSGFQILSQATDIGRLSSTPILRKGLGLLDVEFKPLICTDHITATIVGKSFMTDAIGEEVTGFHCHTYGEIIPHKQAKPILVSHVQRLNYRIRPKDFVSGFTNKDGNVVGILTHALLDENPVIIQSVMESLNISPEELQEIRAFNSRLMLKVKEEVGVSTNTNWQSCLTRQHETPVLLFTTATGSGSGKTFIVTGVAGALKKKGVNVGLIKVGGDIRDIVPALYLIKEPIREYSSIKIGNTGWTPLFESVENASKDYDLLLIEGAMGPFTGFFKENVEHPSTTAEVAVALGVPTILVVACDKAGIEGAVTTGLNYVSLLMRLGVKVVGIVLNKASTSYMTDEMRQFINSAFAKLGIEVLGVVPRIKLEGRGAIPEIEIKYEEFGAKAIQTVEESLDLEKLKKIAKPSSKSSLDYTKFLEKFKTLLTTGCIPDESEGGTSKK
jgi:cobyric acid synthase